MTIARHLARLDTLKTQCGAGCAEEKRTLVEALGAVRLTTPAQVIRFHETLAFLHAFPDDAELFAVVDRLLAAFGERADVRRFRQRLTDSGIAGTDIYYRFHAATARWLADRWPERLTVDWEEVGDVAELERRLHLLALASESPGFDEPPLPFRAWLDRLRGAAETDATFLIRRFAAQPMPNLLRNRYYDSIGLMVRLSPGSGTPSRTGPRFSGSPVRVRSTPFRHDRPDLTVEATRAPRRVRAVTRSDAERLIDLTREAMVTRSRDLYTFEAADPRDVRLVDCADGLELACIGVVPEQRLLLESVYGWLVLRNGVPTGYALTSALFGSSEIAFNVFETFRGAEAAWIYARLLAAVRALFVVDTFTIFPYQLGHGNDEGLQSGAWWFYYKLGFRPRDGAARMLADAEVGRIARRRTHRSSLATLRALAAHHLFLHLDRRRDDVIGIWPADGVGLAVSEMVASRFGSDRERAARQCADEAADLMWAGDWRRFPESERQAWERWGPVIVMLPGARSWSPEERRALVDVVRAKGGRRESDFVARFDQHTRLRSALRSLGRLGVKLQPAREDGKTS